MLVLSNNMKSTKTQAEITDLSTTGKKNHNYRYHSCQHVVKIEKTVVVFEKKSGRYEGETVKRWQWSMTPKNNSVSREPAG